MYANNISIRIQPMYGRGLYSSRLFNCLPTGGFHQKYPSTLVSNQNVAITPLIIDFYYIFKLNIYLQASIVL